MTLDCRYEGETDVINISENEIMKNWNTSKYKEPLVTIRCMAYNHGQYISSAIEGFLKQKTTFPFVIFIHDDCSTDNTASIIREYQKRYPNMIHAIFEDENQWSKKDGSWERISRENIHTKYAALCEGDDYWIDEEKLEKQVGYLERNPECAISITNGKVLNLQNEQYESIFQNSEEELFGRENQIITLDNCASIMFPPTASYVYRHDAYDKGIDDVPKCFNGDLRIRLYYMTKGYCYYFKDETVVYRKNVANSAMTRASKQNRSNAFSRAKNTCEMIDYIDGASGFKHSDELWKVKLDHLLTVISNSRKLTKLRDPVCSRAFRQCALPKKLKIIIKIVTPEWLYARLRNG